MESLNKKSPIGKKLQKYVKNIFKELNINAIPQNPEVFEVEKTEEKTEEKREQRREETLEEKEQAEREDRSEKNPIIGIYRTHYIFIFGKCLGLVLLSLGIGILLSFLGGIFSSNNLLDIALILIIFIPIILRILLQYIVHWKANAIVIRKKNLVFYKYSGVFTQSTEVRSIAQIKSFDIIQSGMFQYLLNYGDIEVASMISGASKKIVLKNIHPVKEAYKLLSRHIESLDEKKGKERGNSSEIPDDDDDESQDEE